MSKYNTNDVLYEYHEDGTIQRHVVNNVIVLEDGNTFYFMDSVKGIGYPESKLDKYIKEVNEEEA